MIYASLIISFAKVGMLGFGGGYAMIPLIQHEIEKFGISGAEFIDILALSQITPGPIGINTSTYAGYKVAGVAGSFAATFANALPTFCLMLIFARLFYRFRDKPVVEEFFKGIRPLFIGMIASSVVVMARDIRIWADHKAAIIFAASFILLFRFKVDPVLLIILAGTIGLVIY